KDVINYEYVILSPAGEEPEGTSAWKLTNASGCFLYILHTCGNGFYPNEKAGGGAYCKVATITPQITAPAQQKDSVKRPVLLTMNSYLAQIVRSNQKRKKYDTLYRLIHHRDSLFYIRDKNVVPWKISTDSHPIKIMICSDSSILLNIPVTADSLQQTDPKTPIRFVLADTSYKKEEPEPENACDNNWEISVDAGRSFNSIPRLDDPVQHTQTNGAQLTAELAISKILSQSFQLGVSAS